MTTLDLEETYRQHIRQARERQMRGIQDYATTIAAFYHKLIEEGLPDESASIISSYLVEAGRERVASETTNGSKSTRKASEWMPVVSHRDHNMDARVVQCADCNSTIHLYQHGRRTKLADVCDCPHAYRLIVHPDGSEAVRRLDLTR